MADQPKKKTLDRKKSEKENIKKALSAARKLHRKQDREDIREKVLGDDLSLKQRKFCEEYLVDFNAPRAAKVSGYAHEYESNPYYLLQRPNIKAYIAQRKEELKKELAVDQGRVVREYFNVAYSNIASYYDVDEDGYSKFKRWEDLTPDQQAAVSEVSFGIDREGNRFITRIKLFDKMRALEGLGKHLGFFEKDNKQKSELNVTIEQVINELPEEIQDLFRAKLINMGSKTEKDGEGQETRH